ncbi:RHS repeat-associated core domain-containing protein [Labilibaculum euxinus]|uniref:RHS repeat-associated core domain-containing protein n=1 Tax=Labilibaculum euxinus TaxID=2686357 RepID=UPI00293BBC02|nr:RHS repeat-associated core domain-containing protein [Labilibaculum euxinus]
MGTRYFDPEVGRWWAIDPALQGASPYMAMGNNPMMNIDEDGEFAFLAALAIGAAIGAGSYTASIAFSDGGFNNWSWGGFAQSAGIGAVSGVLTAGIGSAFGGVGGAASNSFGAQVLNEAGRAAAHGLAQGGLSAMQGGSFKNGFASGAIGSLGGSVFQATAGAKFANSIGGTVGFSALSGGVGAELSGGNFWRGAGTGATIGLLNHYAHKIENDINEKKLSNSAKKNNNRKDKEVYFVKKGDNLWSIAHRKYNGKYSVGEFLYFNKNIEFGYDSEGNYVPQIYPGQKLIIPRYYSEKPSLILTGANFKSAVEIIINISFDFFMKPTLGPVIPELMRDNQFDPNYLPDA